MEHMQKIVLRFNTGKILKGYIGDFTAYTDIVAVQDAQTDEEHKIPIIELKAIFFVKTFEGDRSRRDKKMYGISQNVGRKVYIRFNDGESMMGFLEGDIPWEKGFYLSKPASTLKGFFLVPVDGDSNNKKVFVVNSSIKDITLLP
jgi:hypothetical protein